MEGLEPHIETEAVYELERPIKCTSCLEQQSELHVVRMLRTRVNFTSNLPRRGCLVVCPTCSVPIPAIVGGRLNI